MAKLKTGSAITSECQEVDRLPIRNLQGTGNVLAYATPTGVTAAGKLLLAGRRSDYITLFAAQDLTVCEDHHSFCEDDRPLFLALSQGGGPPPTTRWLAFVGTDDGTPPGLILGFADFPGQHPGVGDNVTISGVPLIGGVDVNGTWTMLSFDAASSGFGELCGLGIFRTVLSYVVQIPGPGATTAFPQFGYQRTPLDTCAFDAVPLN